MILISVYKNKNKIKAVRCVGPDGHLNVTNKEFFDMIREFPQHDIKFIDVNNGGEDITYKCLLNILAWAEKNISKTNENLSHVVSGGGFIKYINKLESTNI